MSPNKMKIRRKERDYKEMYAIALDCTARVTGKNEMSMQKFAKKAKLAPGTIMNILNRITGLPQFRTLANMATAAGFKLTMTRR